MRIYDRALGEGEISEDEATPLGDGEGGDVYVAESGRIEAFSPTGAFIRQIGSAGTGNGQFRGLQAIAADGDGHI